MNNSQEEKLKIQIDDSIINMGFKGLLKTYFKDTHQFLTKMNIEEVDTGFVTSEDNSLSARMETYQYYCFNEDSSKDMLIVSYAIKNIFNDLEIKAKNVYNPLYPEINKLFIREDITYDCFIRQLTKRRCIRIYSRFGFYNIEKNYDCETFKIDDGQEIPH